MVFGAMYEGIKHIFKRTFTLKYPYQKPLLPKGFRGRHILYMEKCTGCGICACDLPQKDASRSFKPQTGRSTHRTLKTDSLNTGTHAAAFAISVYRLTLS